MQGRVLIIAGSDSGGGAGIQADIKTVTALDGFATTAITALTAQNTEGVHGVMPVDIAFIRQQMEVVLRDIGADSIKIGMLHNAEVINVVYSVLGAAAAGIPLVVDPVMVAKGGASLLNADAAGTLRKKLLPLATVITPNIPEAEALLGSSIGSVGDMEEAARALRAMGPAAVLVKGGHMEGDELVDLLVDEDGVHRFETRRIHTVHTHGTGCSLASAIATGLAQGNTLVYAVRRAQTYVAEAIRTAPGFGSGHGPINHAHTLHSFRGV